MENRPYLRTILGGTDFRSLSPVCRCCRPILILLKILNSDEYSQPCEISITLSAKSSFFAMLYLALLFFISLRVGQIQYRIDNAG